MKQYSFSGFTLTEILVVLIIVAILASLAIPNYNAAREKAFDREAIAGLKLIRAGERQYFGRAEVFWPYSANVTNIADINGNLSVDLDTNHWVYSVAGGVGICTATASRAGRWWTITQASNDPTCGGTCY